MWIRSQDKQLLIEADRICISRSRIYQQDECGELTLGVYSSKEKALKVLDMIEQQIRMSEMFKLHIFEPLNRTESFIFQMPPDRSDEE